MVKSIYPLLFLLCLCKANTFTMTPTYTQMLNIYDMTIIDFVANVQGYFFVLYANSSGYMLASYNRLNGMQYAQTELFNHYVDLTNLDNPYNPYIIGHYSISKPSLNTQVHGGTVLFVYIFNFSPLYRSTNNMPFFFKGVYDVSSYSLFFLDEVGNEGVIDALKNGTTFNQQYTYQPSPQQNITSTAFRQSKIYLIKNTGILVDNTRSQLITIDLTYVAPTSITRIISTRKVYSISGYVQRIDFASLNINIMFLKFSDGTVASANISPFLIVKTYGAVGLGQKGFYDPVTNSLIQVDSMSGQICFHQVEIASLVQTELFCQNFAEALISTDERSIQIASYVYYNTTEYTFKTCSDATTTTVNFCNSCASGCEYCDSTYHCTSCSQNYNLWNNFCCLAGYGVNITSTGGTVTKSCFGCALDCLSCNDATNCSVCSTNLTLLNGRCVNNTVVPLPNAPSIAPSIAPSDTPSSSPSTPNSTSIASNESSLSSFSLQQIGVYFEDAIEMANKVPSARAIFRFVFSALMSFDDLYLYYYHERQYGNATETFLSKIRQLENDKWEALSTYLSTYFDSMEDAQLTIQNSMDFYYDYSSPRYVEIQGYGEGVILNCFNFITTNFFASTAIFFVFKIFFWLTFNYKISVLFRPYSFTIYLLYFVLQSNVQALIFNVVSSFRLAFSFNYRSKVLLSFNYYLGFFLLLFSISGYILVHNKLRKYLKYFVDNIQECEKMILYLTLTVGVKNLLMGFVHSYFRRLDQANKQFLLLLLIQLACLLIYFYYLRRDCYEFKYKIWMTIAMLLLRLVFISVLAAQQQFGHSQYLRQLCEQILSPLLLIYNNLTYLNIFINLLIVIIEVIISCVSLLRRSFSVKIDIEQHAEQNLLPIKNTCKTEPRDIEGNQFRTTGLQNLENTRMEQTTGYTSKKLKKYFNKKKKGETLKIKKIRFKTIGQLMLITSTHKQRRQ